MPDPLDPTLSVLLGEHRAAVAVESLAVVVAAQGVKLDAVLRGLQDLEPIVEAYHREHAALDEARARTQATVLADSEATEARRVQTAAEAALARQVVVTNGWRLAAIIAGALATVLSGGAVSRLVEAVVAAPSTTITLEAPREP